MKQKVPKKVYLFKLSSDCAVAIDFSDPDNYIFPETVSLNNQFAKWVESVGSPRYDFNISKKDNMLKLKQSLGFWPTPLEDSVFEDIPF